MTDTYEGDFNELPNDHEVVSRARAIFRSACENADSYHTLRLGLGRRRALNALAKRSPLRTWVPLAGIATACCVFAIGIALLHPAAPVAPSSGAAASTSVFAATDELGNIDSEALPDVGSKQMELVQNLDFYRWLASQQTVARSTPKGRP